MKRLLEWAGLWLVIASAAAVGQLAGNAVYFWLLWKCACGLSLR